MDIQQLYIAGINYKKSDTLVRGQFAINQDQYALLLKKALQTNIKELFVLSTCNRTEIYAIADSAQQLIKLLCSETAGTMETFSNRCYIKQGEDAAEHLFNVAAGLDSQLLGDYEIVGQIKKAVKFSKQHGCIGAFMERLINTVLQSSKAIKSQTQLSGGTVSVSFAAVQYLRDTIADIQNKKIVLLGTGKIGRNTCKNLVDYAGAKNITLINRTGQKAAELANELNLSAVHFSDSLKHIDKADIIIVATNADEPIITQAHLSNCNNKVLIDLSIPNNIEPAVKNLPRITLVNVDDLSKINDKTLQRRMNEIPEAKKIIVEHFEEFIEWYNMRKNVPVLKAAKQKLLEMHQHNSSNLPDYKFSSFSGADTIQKVINNMAVKMRLRHQPGCNYIEALHDFITSNAN